MAKWEKDALEALILAFKQNECLYDIKAPGYFKREKNREALEAVVELVKPFRPDSTVREVKTKLRSLRCQFMREYRRVIMSTETGAELYTPKFIWYDELYFLRDHIHHKKLSTRTPEEEEEEGEVKKKVTRNEYPEFGNFVTCTMLKLTNKKAQKLRHAIMRQIIEVESEDEDE